MISFIVYIILVYILLERNFLNVLLKLKALLLQKIWKKYKFLSAVTPLHGKYFLCIKVLHSHIYVSKWADHMFMEIEGIRLLLALSSKSNN